MSLVMLDGFGIAQIASSQCYQGVLCNFQGSIPVNIHVPLKALVLCLRAEWLENARWTDFIRGGYRLVRAFFPGPGAFRCLVEISRHLPNIIAAISVKIKAAASDVILRNLYAARQ
jgi:hypothetical protein